MALNLHACLNCGAGFDSARISAKQRFATCTHCGTLHNVASLVAPKDASPLRPIALPELVTYSETAESSTITATRQHPGLFAMAFIPTTFISIGALVIAVFEFKEGHQSAALYAVAFLALLGLTALQISSGFRRAEMSIQDGTLSVQWRPWSFWTAYSVPLQEVKGAVGLHVSELQGHEYRVVLLQRDGQKRPLVPGRMDLERCDAITYLVGHAILHGTTERPAASEQVKKPKLGRRARAGTAQVSVFLRPSVGRARAGAKQLKCECCAAPISPESIDREQRTAVCDYCGIVADVADFLKLPRRARIASRYYLPTHMTLKRAPDQGLTLHVGPDDKKVSRFQNTFFPSMLLSVLGAPLLSFLAFVITESGVVSGVTAAAAFVTGVLGAGLSLRWASRQLTYEVTLEAGSLTRKSTSTHPSGDFSWILSRVSQFLALQYMDTEGRQLYAVLAESKDGHRGLLVSDLETRGGALDLAEEFERAKAEFASAPA